MKYHKDQTRASMTPQLALEILKEGNKRFNNNLRFNRNYQEMVNDTAEGQWPFTAVLSCSDSRVSSEIIFDQGIGDIFSVRLAGNIASINAIGSIEYACKVLGSKLIVVLGHTSCGAVKAACDHVQMGNVTTLLDHIYAAVEAETETSDDRTSYNKQFVQHVSHNNVVHQIETIVEESEIIRDMLANHEIGIVGGMYNVGTGVVEFFDEMFDYDEFVGIKSSVKDL